MEPVSMYPSHFLRLQPESGETRGALGSKEGEEGLVPLEEEEEERDVVVYVVVM